MKHFIKHVFTCFATCGIFHLIDTQLHLSEHVGVLLIIVLASVCGYVFVNNPPDLSFTMNIGEGNPVRELPSSMPPEMRGLAQQIEEDLYKGANHDVSKGGVITPELLENAFRHGIESSGRYTVILSYAAYNMAKRIREIQPNFIPDCEVSVWFKANQLGLK